MNGEIQGGILAVTTVEGIIAAFGKVSKHALAPHGDFITGSGKERSEPVLEDGQILWGKRFRILGCAVEVKSSVCSGSTEGCA